MRDSPKPMVFVAAPVNYVPHPPEQNLSGLYIKSAENILEDYGCRSISQGSYVAQAAELLEKAGVFDKRKRHAHFFAGTIRQIVMDADALIVVGAYSRMRDDHELQAQIHTAKAISIPVFYRAATPDKSAAFRPSFWDSVNEQTPRSFLDWRIEWKRKGD